MKKTWICLFLVLSLAAFLRFYNLDSLPTGFHQDEASQAYNAYALGLTGQDRYGEPFPILFRSFGSYQPPVYTYLTILPVKLFGNTLFAARFISALFGTIVVLLTFLIIRELVKERTRNSLAVVAALVLAISPWAIHFSRRVVEANLGFVFFLTGFYFAVLALRKPYFFLLAMLSLGIATHAYYSERISTLLFIFVFLLVFRRQFWQNKWTIFLGLIIFGLTQLPHLYISASGAFSNRFTQVSYLASSPGGLAGLVYLLQQFCQHFLNYLSPRYLFADTGSDLARVAPGLGVFYGWLFIPFIVGVVAFVKEYQTRLVILVSLLSLVALVPAALTGDAFNPLRALDFLWAVTVVISLGLWLILDYFRQTVVKYTLVAIFISWSLVVFYFSYAILNKYEVTEYTAQAYRDLNQELINFPEREVMIDSWRDYAIGLRLAYFRKADPRALALVLRPQIGQSYYGSDFSNQETYQFGNIKTGQFDFSAAKKENVIIVGDIFSVSEDQAKEHNLKPLFDIKGANKVILLKAYATSPKEIK